MSKKGTPGPAYWFRIILLLSALMIVPFVTASAESAETVTRSYDEFIGKNIGVLVGSVQDAITQEHFDTLPLYYSNPASAIEDVRQHRLDGYMNDILVLLPIINEPGNDVLAIAPIPKEIFTSEVAGFAAKQDMVDRYNAFFLNAVSAGIIDDMLDYWVYDNLELNAAIREIPQSGENGKLLIAVSTGLPPFIYTGDNGRLEGFCIELAMRFAAHEGMEAHFIDMDLSGVIPFVLSDKADISIMPLAVTEERKNSVIFTEPFFQAQSGIIYLQQVSHEQIRGDFFLIKWLKNAIERNLLTDHRWKMVVHGLGVTMAIAFLSQIFGTIFGCFICFLITRRKKLPLGIGNAFCGMIRGTPAVVLLMITYYIIFRDSQISNVLIAVFSFTMIVGVSVAQCLKGAIDTVAPVEIEAARSLGFSSAGTFITVTLPQAVRRALPSYTNGFVELVKSTAIVGYIAIQDLTRAADIIRSRTYDPYFPLLLISLIYLLITSLCVILFKHIVRKINKGSDEF